MEISLEPEALHETSWLIVFTILQMICLAKVLWKAVANWMAVKEFLKQCTSCVCWARRAGADPLLPEDEEAQLVKAKAQQSRVALASYVNSGLLMMWLVLCMIVQVNILVPGAQSRWMSAQLSWLHIICLTFFGGGFCFPSLFRPCLLDLWYTMGMVLCTLMLTPLCTTTSQSIGLSFFVTAVFRLPSTLVCTRPWWVILCNVVPFLVMELRILRGRTPSHSCDLEFSKLNAAMWEIFALVFVSVASVAVERNLWARVRQGILIKQAATELTAASSLLQLTCDAVVELDEDLRLATAVSELEAMLLHSSLRGKIFTELMPTREEAERAEQILRADDSTSHIWTNVFHTRLVDSCSSKFRTEVFHVKYMRLNGRTCHLIGLRDFTDQSSLAGHTAVDSLGGRGTCWPPNDFWQCSKMAKSRHMSHSRRLPMDQISDSSGGSQKPRKIFLQIDMYSLQVVSASVCAAFLTGKVLSELFGPAELRFLEQVWNQVQALHACKQLENKELNFGNLEMLWESSSVFISGRIEVIQLQHEKLGFLLTFPGPVPSHKPRTWTSSPGLSPISDLSVQAQIQETRLNVSL